MSRPVSIVELCWRDVVSFMCVVKPNGEVTEDVLKGEEGLAFELLLGDMVIIEGSIFNDAVLFEVATESFAEDFLIGVLSVTFSPFAAVALTSDGALRATRIAPSIKKIDSSLKLFNSPL